MTSRGWRSASGGLALLLLVAATAVADDAIATVTGTVQVQPLAVDLSVSPQQMATGEHIRIEVVVHNQGQVRVQDVTVTLHRPDEGLLIHRKERLHVSNLHGGQARELRWQGCASTTGSFGLLVRAEVRSIDGQDLTVESATRLLHVTHEGPRPCR